MKKILIYTHDTYGLGNARRMLAIASHLVKSSEEISILLVSGSTMLHTFRHGPRIDYIKLPCLSRDTEGKYKSRYLDYDFDRLLKMRSDLIASAFFNFQPDLVLVDKKPLGVGGELSQTLKIMKSEFPKTRCVLLLRDILDAPEKTAQIWHKQNYFRDIDTYYQKILVVGKPEVFDLCKKYQFPKKTCKKVEFCGYLAREPGVKSRFEVRSNLSIDVDQPLVLAMVGGGEDGYHLLEVLMQGVQRTKGTLPYNLLIVSGPEMPAFQRTKLNVMASQSPQVDIIDYSDDVMGLIDASDLVISMAGYNTVCEFLTLKKPAIVIPRVEPSLEQWIRAREMDNLGLLRAIHPNQLTPWLLQHEIKQLLKDDASVLDSLQQFEMDGLSRVTNASLNLIPSLATIQRSMPEQLLAVGF